MPLPRRAASESAPPHRYAVWGLLCALIVSTWGASAPAQAKTQEPAPSTEKSEGASPKKPTGAPNVSLEASLKASEGEPAPESPSKGPEAEAELLELRESRKVGKKTYKKCTKK